ncbi:diaminopimelate epimerase [Sanguibacter sp. HDW7]|uniref:diaminopimelate epimerase n=1 Tax=Sanguibacter sp. HDW7 TaxID=2714931 RepID=UPI001409307C|nr:diaminopimelate epimerase [Sanguibacter sp. HDW7]QIK83289.1 diaminopimelate epimerase [Sanguibacter sp. HDW7]
MTTPATLAVTKGHGTQNDFVLLDDRTGTLELDADLVRALADRRAGVGGDGVIRVVRSADLPEGAAVLAADPAAEWFMDYRNADGSLAQMCGNGVRVFVRFLEHLGLADLSDGARLAIGTRAGVRYVTRVVEGYAVDMGVWHLPGGEAARTAGHDALVSAAGLVGERPALSVDMGNPHTVVALASDAELDALDLTRAPAVTPVPPEGTNVELVVPLGEEATPDGVVGHVRMRVHERGVGETRSCGTGACAAALAVATWAGSGAPSVWRVDVPGGTVTVTMLDGDRVELAGPAELVAHGEVDVAALVRGATL